jgi:hypothetical protein
MGVVGMTAPSNEAASAVRWWTPEQEAALVRLYEDAGQDGVVRLSEFAASIGKHKTNVCRKARELGLSTSTKRRKVETRKVRVRKFATDAELRAAVGDRMRNYIATNGHVRGMLGKSHSQATKDHLRAASKANWEAMTEDQKDAHSYRSSLAAVKANQEKNWGRGTWKAGWREIGDKRNFYRSRWEANYGRYLEWLKTNGQITDWAHEPETFWFDAIKRGVRSYKPDFRVWENDGTSRLHEVKGWMDDRSRTCLKRMAKYHPHETIVLIDGPQYRAIRLKVMRLVPDWEDSKRDAHA